MKYKRDATLKFEVTEQLGDWMGTPYFRYFSDPQKESFEWKVLHHRDHDGVSGFTHLMENEGYQVIEQPLLKDKKHPSFFKKLLKFFSYIKIVYKGKIQWKNKKKITGVPEGFVTIFFDKKLTLKLEAEAKRKKGNLSTLLLIALDQVVYEKLLTKESDRKWISPINMRTAEKPVEMGNNVSSIVVNFSSTEDVTIESVYKYIRNYFRNGLHWGAWLYSHLPTFLGYRLTYLLAKNAQGLGTGVFSFLGRWPESGKVVAPKNEEEFHRGALAPASLVLPVAATGMIWRDKLALTLHIHPSLDVDLIETKKMAQKWVESFVSDEDKDSVEYHSKKWRDFQEVREFLNSQGREEIKGDMEYVH